MHVLLVTSGAQKDESDYACDYARHYASYCCDNLEGKIAIPSD